MFMLDWSVFFGAFLGALTAIILLASTIIFFLNRKRAWITEKIESLISQRIEERSQKFSSEIERRVKTAVSQGITQGVSSIPSTEVLKKTHKTITRTGREIVGNGIQSIFGRKPTPQNPIKPDQTVSEPKPKPPASPER